MKLLFTLTILISYIGLIISAPIHFIQMAESDMPMEHCPFAEGGHTVCAMTPFDHMKSWRLFTLATLSIFILSIALYNFTRLFVSDLSAIIISYLSRLRRLTRRYSSYFEMLFATGILHPKIP